VSRSVSLVKHEKKADEPTSVCDGGAPVATSTVGPAVTTQEAAMQELTEISEKHGLYDPGPIPSFLRRTA
jgi:hypothetical protein